MRKYVGGAHVSEYIGRFPGLVDEHLRYWSDKGLDIEVHYAQSAEPCGRVLFSALVTAWETET